jgi:malate dehydrogenase (oxaloacetate-decarboxylating)(NADP+)
METGVARKAVDIDEYRERLEGRLGPAREAMRAIRHRARNDPRTIVFPEGEHPKVLRAAAEVVEDGVARPLVLGDEARISKLAKENGVPMRGISIQDPARWPKLDRYVETLWDLRRRKGVTREDAARLVLDRNIFGALMVRLGDADGLVSGLTQHYPDTIRPMLQIIRSRDDVRTVVAVFALTFRNRTYFLGDAAVNVEPDADTLAEIAILTSEVARRFQVEPRVAMLSFSNFGSVQHRLVRLVQDAVARLKERAPDLPVDGEMQADTAVCPDLARELFPFSRIQGDANVLIFPDLTSSNIAYKLLHRLGGAELIGPILVGMKQPVNVLHQGSELQDVVNLAALAVVDAQELSPRDAPPSPTGPAMVGVQGARRT